ncbi:odorant receptor 59a-like [Drosophila busckii]|uniref:odorant receptor 59a-like n=1 Tax=Drosophila busckii TaxID=30019 RepID=UPI0014333E62|nr:odorant receptor 59a-like [Drosophila busckii]
MSHVVNSLSFISSHWLAWKVVGSAHAEPSNGFYVLYAIIFHLVVSVSFPLHLGATLFNNNNITDDMKNLTLFVVTLSCSLKGAFYGYNLQKVRHMEQLLRLLDSRVDSAQRSICDQLRKKLGFIIYGFMGICVCVTISAEMSFFFQKQRKLLYPAWFPFDWHNSSRNYYLAHAYQIVGVSLQVLQNYASDCFPAVMLCIISAQTQMLYNRIENIGMAQESAQDSEVDLEACITDHKHLLEQFVASALNICISIASVVFYVTEPLTRAYFFFYALAMPLQIFPTCYYSTDLELSMGKLNYAAFSCNWLSQRRSFKRKQMLFVERSLKQKSAKAGGMLLIHLNTFMGTLKFAYSLFTIILRLRK